MGKVLFANLIQFIKYFGVSFLALLLDFSCYWVAVDIFKLNQPVSAAFGYLIGLFFSYFLLVKYVFRDGWLRNKKISETILFIVTGIIGAGCTYVVVFGYIYLFQEKNHIAKVCAVGVSFIIVYLLRKLLVFKPSHI